MNHFALLFTDVLLLLRQTMGIWAWVRSPPMHRFNLHRDIASAPEDDHRRKRRPISSFAARQAHPGRTELNFHLHLPFGWHQGDRVCVFILKKLLFCFSEGPFSLPGCHLCEACAETKVILHPQSSIHYQCFTGSFVSSLNSYFHELFTVRRFIWTLKAFAYRYLHNSV